MGHTRRVFRYLRCLRRCRNQYGRAAVRDDFSDLAAACKIHRANGSLRLEVECRLLAAQSNAEIAASMPLAMPVIENL